MVHGAHIGNHTCRPSLEAVANCLPAMQQCLPDRNAVAAATAGAVEQKEAKLKEAEEASGEAAAAKAAEEAAAKKKQEYVAPAASWRWWSWTLSSTPTASARSTR